MSNGPCYRCRERHEACHGTCERYKEWHRQFEKAADQRNNRRDADNVLADGKYRGWWMQNRRK